MFMNSQKTSEMKEMDRINPELMADGNLWAYKDFIMDDGFHRKLLEFVPLRLTELRVCFRRTHHQLESTYPRVFMTEAILKIQVLISLENLDKSYSTLKIYRNRGG